MVPPKVTILIPTYKRAVYLREALSSALAQTYHNLEILVLDDASPDDTSTTVAEFAADMRLRYIRHPANLGIVDNWKAGIEAATGEYFCLLHDDDTFEPSFVETLVQPLIDDPDLILSFCDHWVMDAKGQRLPKASDDATRRFGRHQLRPGVLTEWSREALVASALPVGATVFRRSLVTPAFIEQQAKGSIDAWLFYQCVKTGRGAFYVPQRLMNYRSHSGGMSASMPLYMAEGHLYRYRHILADKSLANLHQAIRQKMAETLVGYGISLLHHGKHHEARQALRDALGLQISRRAVVAYGLACSGRLGTLATAALKKAG